jgi:hypothetical protein
MASKAGLSQHLVDQAGVFANRGKDDDALFQVTHA